MSVFFHENLCCLRCREGRSIRRRLRNSYRRRNTRVSMSNFAVSPCQQLRALRDCHSSNSSSSITPILQPPEARRLQYQTLQSRYLGRVGRCRVSSGRACRRRRRPQLGTLARRLRPLLRLGQVASRRGQSTAPIERAFCRHRLRYRPRPDVRRPRPGRVTRFLGRVIPCPGRRGWTPRRRRISCRPLRRFRPTPRRSRNDGQID